MSLCGLKLHRGMHAGNHHIDFCMHATEYGFACMPLFRLLHACLHVVYACLHALHCVGFR